MKKQLLLALGLLMTGAVFTQAAVLTFDNADAYNDHFTTYTGAFPYSATQGGLYINSTTTALGLLGNASYDPGDFLTETVSVTYSQGSFNANPSMGIVLRTDDNPSYSLKTGIAALVNISSAGQVRLRVGEGTVHGGAGLVFGYDTNFSGLTLTTNMQFTFTVEQRNVAAVGGEQAQVRLIFANADSGVIYADSNWVSVGNVNEYVDPGNIGLRAFAGTGGGNNTTFTIYDFSPVPEAVPEPSTYALLVSALALGGWLRRRQRGGGV